MVAVSAIGYANLFKTGAIIANSSAPGLGPTNLAADQCAPSTGWQTDAGVVTTAGGASLRLTFATSGVTVRGVCLVNTNLTSSATVTVKLWLTSGPTLVDTLAIPGPLTGYGQVIGICSADRTADYLTADFDDIGNPDLHINVGGAFAGPLWYPASGVSWDTSYGRTVSQTKVVSRGGQEYRSRLFSQRFWKLAITAASNAEAWDDLGELDRVASLGGNVLFVPNVTSVDVPREAVYGALDAQSDVTFPYHTTDARAWRAQIAERL